MFNKRNALLVVLICTILTLPSASESASSFSTNATSQTFFDGFQQDPDGPSSTGSFSHIDAFDGFDFEGGDNAYAEAEASMGSGYARVDGAFVTGQPDLNTLTATSILVEEYTNTSGTDQELTFAFTLFGPRLYLLDLSPTGLDETSSPTNSASFDFDVTWDNGNNSPFSVFSSSGQVTGGSGGHILTTGGSHQLASVFDDAIDPIIFGYNFDNLTRGLMATIEPGETWSFTTTLTAHVEGQGFDTGGFAYIGDPNELTPGFESTIFAVSVVPEPVSSTLFVIGALSLGYRQFRKKKYL